VVESKELDSGASTLVIVSKEQVKWKPVLRAGTSDKAASDRTLKK
jgi:hypothetical protein